MNTENLNAINPFKGLNTYRETDSALFYGRSSETRALSEQIFSRKSTIITGASGSGKSSLINAGLIPILRNNGYIPIKITPNSVINEDIADIWSAISDRISQTVSTDNIGYKAISDIGKDLLSSNLFEKLNCFEYFDEFGFEVSFVFIIDQFEEIFQKHFNLKSVSHFFATYQGICVNKFPKYENWSTEVFNQSLCPLNSNKENNHKFIISVRQDYLFEIDKYSVSFPLLQQNRFHLSKLNEEQAYEIITSPVKIDGSTWFNEEDATLILKNLLQTDDFIRDGIPEQEVDAMLLSVYLYQTVDAYLKQKEVQLTNADDILADFYNERMQIYGIEQLEERLISDNGLYRQSISYEDSLKYIYPETIKHLESEGILNISYRDGNTYIELHHDRLCTCAKDHITICRIKSLNQRRFDASAYLSMRYRVLHENSYWFLSHGYAEYTSHIKWKSFIIQRFKENKAGISGDYTSLFRDTSNAHSYSAILKFSSKYGDGDQTTFDGISQFELKYVHGLLYSLSFKDMDGNPVSVYTGISRINFYYDKHQRIYLIEYLDVHGQKQIVQDGYSAILYEYPDNNSKLPDHTYYIDLPLDFEYSSHHDTNIHELIKTFIVQHKEGNCGYRSKYNIYGCEIERTFIDKYDNECNTFEGFSRLVFEKTEEDELLSISYYSGQEPVLNNEGIHKVVFTYQKGSDGYESRYFNKDLQPCPITDGSYGSKVIIDFENHNFKHIFVGKGGSIVENNDGSSYQLCKFDDKYNITAITNINSKEEPIYTIRMIHTSNGLCKLIEESDIMYIDYDEKCRILNQRHISSQFIETIANFEYNNNGDYSVKVLSKNNNETDGFKNRIIWFRNRGLQRIEQWDEGLFLKLNINKDNEFLDGNICNSDGKITIDPNYGASEIQQTKDQNGHKVRIFLNNGIEVRKEFLDNDEEIDTVEIYYNGGWRMWETHEDYNMIWELDSLKRPIIGYICLKDGSPDIKYDGPFDSIRIKYTTENIARTYFKNNVAIQKILSDSNGTILKEYTYNNGIIDLNCVKYLIDGNPDNFRLYDESINDNIIPVEKEGYHKYGIINYSKDDLDYEISGYFNIEDNPVNGQEGWAIRITKRKKVEPHFEINKIIVTCHDENGNPHNGPLNFFGFHGSALELNFISSYILGYSLIKTPFSSEKNQVVKENLKKLRFWEKHSFINNALKPNFQYFIDFRNTKFDIYKLSSAVTKINASQINENVIASYFVTSKDGFKDIVFFNGEKYIHNVIHFGINTYTRPVISILSASNPNVLNDDIVIQFGNWNFFDYNKEECEVMLETFDQEFKLKTSNCETTKILLARKTTQGWQCFRGVIKFEKDKALLGKLGDTYLPIKDICDIEKSKNDFYNNYPIE